MAVNIYLTVKDKHSKVCKCNSVPLSEESATVFFQEFRSQVRDKYDLEGDVTVHRATKDNTTGALIRGRKITEIEFTLADNEEILVLYDKTIFVIPGGGATGADVVSNSDGPGTAGGGRGTGGSIDADGNVKGGSGFGGDGHGRNISGTAGKGFGAKVVASAPGKKAKGGAGYGGELKPRMPDGPSN